jgi:hypothetical protein
MVEGKEGQQFNFFIIKIWSFAKKSYSFGLEAVTLCIIYFLMSLWDLFILNRLRLESKPQTQNAVEAVCNRPEVYI